MWPRGLLLFVGGGVAFASIALPARAEPSNAAASVKPSDGGSAAEGQKPIPNEERARLAFSRGKSLASEGRYVNACKSFEESLALIEGVGTMYNLADCYEKLGKNASAQRMFLRAASVSENANEPERAQAARDRAAVLEPKLARLLVQVEAIDASVEIKSDDEHLEPGTGVPVDPGAHRITATAPGKQTWSTSVKVPSEPVVVSVIVPALQNASPSQPPREKPAPAPRPARTFTPSLLSSDVRPQESRPGHSAALILGGVGLASIATGGVFAILYKKNDDDARAICPSGVQCTSQEIAHHGELVDDAKRARLWSYVGFGAGAAALGGATILYFTSHRRAQSGVVASAAAAPDGSWSAAVRGRF